jgi:pimeloyl-ACP methyl ester carboxylesterase
VTLAKAGDGGNPAVVTGVVTEMKRIFLILAGLVLALLLAAGAWAWAPDLPRAQLESRWAAPPSRFEAVLGTRLHIRETGPRDGPAVILLHGFGSSLHTWEDWAEGLQDRFRVVRIDIPGFGLTGPDPSGDYSDARSIALIAALMDRLGIARASIVGSSMGGRIAWAFAAAEPDRVEKLVLMAPDGFASPGLDYGKAAKVPLAARLLPWVLPPALLRMSLAPAYADAAAMTEARVERYGAMLRAPGVRQAILDRMGDHVLVPPEPILRRIRAPVLLAWGEQDRMVPVTNAADYQREIPQARLVTWPGIGHVPMEEDPARTLREVRAFLEE